MRAALAIVLLFPWAVLIALAGEWYIPPSYWFSVNKFYVYDTASGAVPKVSLDRDIRRRITVRWYMTLYASKNGTFEPGCRAEGRDTRSPGDRSPNSLSWWYDSSPCVTLMPPGKYYVEEEIEWQGFALIHYTQAISNVFTIWPPGDPHLSGMDLEVPPSEAPERKRIRVSD